MSIDKSTPHTSLKSHEKFTSNNKLDDGYDFSNKNNEIHKQIATNYRIYEHFMIVV